jgi:hypothetical protein
MIGRVLQLRGDHNPGAWNVNYVVRYLEYENGENSHETRGLNPQTDAGWTLRREFATSFAPRRLELRSQRKPSRTYRRFGTHTFLIGGEYFAQDHVFRAGRAANARWAVPVPAMDLFAPVYGQTRGSLYGISSFH